MLGTFCGLENVFLATAACNFSTSQVQKVVRTPDLACFAHVHLKMCFSPQRLLYILSCKCDFCRGGMQFFNISSTKSGSDPCFVHFDFKMCFFDIRTSKSVHIVGS